LEKYKDGELIFNRETLLRSKYRSIEEQEAKQAQEMGEHLNSCKKEPVIKVEEYHKKRKKKKEKLDWYQKELERKFRKLKKGKRIPYYMT
jgi:hypothetical protein